MTQRTLPVALVQHACNPSREDNLQRSIHGIRQAAEQGAQLILLQELHTSLYFCQTEDTRYFDLAEPIPGPTTKKLAELAKELQVVIVTSLFEKRATGLYHNTAVVLERDGSLAGRYRKMHIPDDPGYHEKFYFTPGDLGFRPISTSVGKLGVLISHSLTKVVDDFDVVIDFTGPEATMVHDEGRLLLDRFARDFIGLDHDDLVMGGVGARRRRVAAAGGGPGADLRALLDFLHWPPRRRALESLAPSPGAPRSGARRDRTGPAVETARPRRPGYRGNPASHPASSPRSGTASCGTCPHPRGRRGVRPPRGPVPGPVLRMPAKGIGVPANRLGQGVKGLGGTPHAGQSPLVTGPMFSARACR